MKKWRKKNVYSREVVESVVGLAEQILKSRRRSSRDHLIGRRGRGSPIPASPLALSARPRLFALVSIPEPTYSLLHRVVCACRLYVEPTFPPPERPAGVTGARWILTSRPRDILRPILRHAPPVKPRSGLFPWKRARRLVTEASLSFCGSPSRRVPRLILFFLRSPIRSLSPCSGQR